MDLRAVLLFALACGSTAAHAQQPLPAALPQTTLAPQPAQVTDNTAVLTGEWITSGRSTAPVFGVDLMLGQQTGIRPNLALYSTERSSFVVEGFYGGLFTKFGAAETAGGGVRWRTNRGGPDAVTLGPGVDVLFHLNDNGAVILAPTVDIAWQHSFGDRAAFFLGLNAGVGIGISSKQRNYYYYSEDPVAGRVTPLISFFAGLQF